MTTKKILTDVAHTGVILGATGATASPSFSFVTDTDTGIWLGSANTICIGVSGAEQFRIASNGNVGIGGVAPSTVTDIKKVSIKGTVGGWIEVQNATGSVGVITFGGTAGVNTHYNYFVTGTSNSWYFQDSTGTTRFGIYHPAASGIAAEFVSTTGGFVPPRMTTTERNAISSPVNGSIIYNSTTSTHNLYENGGWHGISGVCEIPFIIDGGGSTITTGIKGDLKIPFACTINSWDILCDVSGSITIDIWKDTYANFPPVDADSITASATPSVSSATKNQSSTLTGWTTTINADDILRFNVDSVTSCTRVTLCLKVTKI